MGCVGWRDCSTQDMVAEPFCIHRPCRGPCVTAGLHACAVCRAEGEPPAPLLHRLHPSRMGLGTRTTHLLP